MSTASTPAATISTPAAPRPGWRRALAVDLSLQRGTWLTTLALALISLALVPLLGDGMIGLAPIWAALAWYRYGRGDTPERTLLPAGLGISRADRVRGRVALVGVESALLLAVGAAGAAIGHAVGHGSLAHSAPIRVALDPGALHWDAVLGLGLGLVVLPVTAAMIGGECTTRRPGWGMAPLSVLAYLGAGVMVAMALGQVLLPLALAGLGEHIALYLVLNLAGIAGVLLLLRSRVRVWIESLDGPHAGGPAAG